MKLEKMNEQQIRCTLTKEDLAARRIKLSELAYGTESARSLFREMMELAEAQLDFEAGDMPLMVEAVPMNTECIVLTITKVDDPEELDTRFAQFSPSLIDDSELSESDEDSYDFNPDAADETDGIFSHLHDIAAQDPAREDIPLPSDLHLSRLFSFGSMDACIRLAGIIVNDSKCGSILYKDSSSGRYLLLLEQDGTDLPMFNRICNIISEYGESERNLLATQAFMEEHYDCLIASKAIEKLAQI